MVGIVDISPAAAHHFLMIPRVHIGSVHDLQACNAPLGTLQPSCCRRSVWSLAGMGSFTVA